jgi:NTE family protein
MSNKIQIPKEQRALLQGGGSLGAYDAGAFRAIYEHFVEEDNKVDGSLFDIVAGTSSGAINAAVLVSYVARNRTWRGLAEQLEKFWHYLSSTTNLTNWWPFSIDDNSWISTWDERHRINNNAAIGEAARRYYSAKEYLYSGVPNVFSKPKIGYDNKFFDEFYPPVNIWYKYDNQPLKKSIGEFVTEPIATCYSEHNYEQSNKHNTIFKQPRLLLVSVDIEEGTSVVFDSYLKDKHVDKRYSNYKSEVIGRDKKNNIEKIIKYDKGITVDHIIASASVPINYDYTILEVDVHPSRYINTNNNISNNKHKGYFWDGGLLSNSPLRELIQAHRDYWLMMNNISTVDNGLKANKKTEKNYEESENKKTPDLDLYIVDVHPSKIMMSLLTAMAS